MSLEERLKEVRERAERAKQKIDEKSKQRLLKELHMSWECVRQSLTETVNEVLPQVLLLAERAVEEAYDQGEMEGVQIVDSLVKASEELRNYLLSEIKREKHKKPNKDTPPEERYESLKALLGKESDISAARIEEVVGYTPRVRAVVMGKQPLWVLYAREDGTKAYRRKSPKELIEEAVERKRVVKVDGLLLDYKPIQEAKLSGKVVSEVLESIGWRYDKERDVYRKPAA